MVDSFFLSRSETAWNKFQITVHHCPLHISAPAITIPSDMDNRMVSLNRDGLVSLLEYCRLTDAFYADMWMWPLYEQARQHYSLLIVGMKNNTILYLDPHGTMQGVGPRHIQEMMSFLLDNLHYEEYGDSLPWNQWAFHTPLDVPQQSSDNCGPLICVWAHTLCSDTIIDVSSDIAPQTRQWIKSEISKEPSTCQKNINCKPLQKTSIRYPKMLITSSMCTPTGFNNTSSYLASVNATLFKATAYVCAAETCIRPSQIMTYCVTCHDWYHQSCLERLPVSKNGHYRCFICRQLIRHVKHIRQGVGSTRHNV